MINKRTVLIVITLLVMIGYQYSLYLTPTVFHAGGPTELTIVANEFTTHSSATFSVVDQEGKAVKCDLTVLDGKASVLGGDTILFPKAGVYTIQATRDSLTTAFTIYASILRLDASLLDVGDLAMSDSLGYRTVDYATLMLPLDTPVSIWATKDDKRALLLRVNTKDETVSLTSNKLQISKAGIVTYTK